VLEATYSLTVDFDNGESVHSVSGYASLWRWTRRRVSKFLNDCGLEIDSKSKKPGRLKRKNNDSETAHQTAQKQHIGLLVFSKAYETDNTETAHPTTQKQHTPIKNRLKDKDIVEIITYLNTTTGKNFRPASKDTKRHINARLSEGFTPTDFQTVIDNQVAVWSNDTKMAQYLRPATLFGPKFESYLQSANSQPTTQHQPGGLPDYAN